MFGYVITDENNMVEKIVPSFEFDKYKVVDDIENYMVGDVYPKRSISDMKDFIDEYDVAECRFIDGMNDKLYVFKNYCCADAGDYVLVDTIYGPQIAVVVKNHDRGEWDGIKPTKDIISDLCFYDDYEERCKMRKAIARAESERIKKEMDEKKAKEEAEKKSDVKIYHLDEDEFDEVRKYIADIFGDFFK